MQNVWFSLDYHNVNAAIYKAKINKQQKAHLSAIYAENELGQKRRAVNEEAKLHVTSSMTLHYVSRIAENTQNHKGKKLHLKRHKTDAW